MEISTDNINDIYSKYGMSEARRHHSLGVAKIAAELAVINKVDTGKAWLAGALHDLTREWEITQSSQYISKHKLKLTKEEREIPYITHGKIAANITREELDINDESVLKAIETHTSGDAAMDTLQAIIYAADFMESTGNNQELSPIHELTRKNLLSGINQINQNTIGYLKSIDRKPTQELLRNLQYYSKY